MAEGLALWALGQFRVLGCIKAHQSSEFQKRQDVAHSRQLTPPFKPQLRVSKRRSWPSWTIHDGGRSLSFLPFTRVLVGLPQLQLATCFPTCGDQRMASEALAEALQAGPGFCFAKFSESWGDCRFPRMHFQSFFSAMNKMTSSLNLPLRSRR